MHAYALTGFPQLMHRVPDSSHSSLVDPPCKPFRRQGLHTHNSGALALVERKSYVRPGPFVEVLKLCK